MARSTGPPSNTILSRCPPELFTGRTETVALKQGFVLQTVGQKAGDIYFPLTFLASLSGLWRTVRPWRWGSSGVKGSSASNSSTAPRLNRTR